MELRHWVLRRAKLRFTYSMAFALDFMEMKPVRARAYLHVFRLRIVTT